MATAKATIAGREVTCVCLIGDEMKQEYLDSEWEFDDLTVFIVRPKPNESFTTLTGLVNFSRWLRDWMANDKSPITFMAAQPKSAQEQAFLKKVWLEEVRNTLRG